MSAAVGNVVGAANEEYAGLGMELLQAVVDHFVPTAAVNLPIIFKEWHELSQNKEELVTIFSSRVSKLALQSKRAGQEYTDISQIVTFVDGIHEGFEEFRKDYFTGRIVDLSQRYHRSSQVPGDDHAENDSSPTLTWTSTSSWRWDPRQ
jgi:hypothetical protein